MVQTIQPVQLPQLQTMPEWVKTPNGSLMHWPEHASLRETGTMGRETGLIDLQIRRCLAATL